MRHSNLLWLSLRIFPFSSSFSLCLERDKVKRIKRFARKLPTFQRKQRRYTRAKKKKKETSFFSFSPSLTLFLSRPFILSFFLSIGNIPFAEGITENANEISAYIYHECPCSLEGTHIVNNTRFHVHKFACSRLHRPCSYVLCVRMFVRCAV